MAPGGGSKRKRGDRGQSFDEAPDRPSPHRPENLNMAQERHGGAGRGGRGAGRRESRQGHPNTPDTPTAPAARKPSAHSQNGTPTREESTAPTPSANVTAPVVPAVEELEEELEEEIPPYAYGILTDEVIGAWNEQSEQSVADSCNGTDFTTIGSLLQELTRSALDRRLDPEAAGSVVRKIKDQQVHDGPDVQSLFLNSLSLLEDRDLKNPALSSFVEATGIDPEAIRAELDIPILQALDLVRPSFAQIRTRKTTNVLYRQANFNLLREESEGYAKLMTEYFNAAQDGAAANDPAMAEAAFQRVKALVGSFDLDVGRVLDITLDISANLLVRAYAFFVKFYRCSSWWPDKPSIDNIITAGDGFRSLPEWALPAPSRSNDTDGLEPETTSRHEAFWARVRDQGLDAFFEIGARRIVDFDSVASLLEGDAEPQLDSRGKEVNADKRKRVNEDRRFMRQTGTLPPSGNSDAAQLLGFKLRFYASEARDAHDLLPDNLIALAAMLIKIGFISLRDLYPHLYPPDEKMADERSRLEKEKAEREAKERPGGGPNALVMAGALTDDTIPVTRNLRADKEKSGGNTPKVEKKDEEAKEELPTPDNQKIMLLKTLLLIGAIPEALYILGRFPWLPEVDTTIPPLLNRIARHMLGKIAEDVRPMKARFGLDATSGALSDTIPNRSGFLSFTDRPRRSANRWLGEDKVDLKAGTLYKFFYAEWADSIPICQTVDDVFLLCDTFLGYLGVKIGQDPEVLGIIARLAKTHLKDDDSEENKTRWLDLMKRLLVPALSLSKHNPELTQLVFDLLNVFPMTTRFNIYAEWYLGKTSRLPDMRTAFAYNKAEAKDVLRRVTVKKGDDGKDNGKKDARALSKISYSSPGIVMMYMINQLEAYSNMIPALVECVKPLLGLAWDVLTWCLINSLSGQGRGRMQADGMLASPWLQALSRFVAALFATYDTMNPVPVLQYLAFKLRAGNSTDLEVFEQLLAGMAGIKADVEFNDSQVLHMATGGLVQTTVLQQLGDSRHTRKSTAKRLLKALDDSKLIGQLLIAIAQEKQMITHHEAATSMPLKVLGNNVDKIRQILAQYLNVLTTGLKPANFEVAVPDVVTLISTFGIEPSMAFVLSRHIIAHRILEHDEAKKLELQEKRRRQSNGMSNENGDTPMNDAEATTEAPAVSLKAGDLDVSGQGQDSLDTVAQVSENTQPVVVEEESPWHPALLPLIDGLKDVCPNLAARVSLPFYVRFWTLSQADVYIFNDPYNHEVSRLSKLALQHSAQRIDSSATAKEKDRKRKGFLEKEAAFRAEMTGRVGRYTKLNNELSREKAHWFPVPPSTQAELDAMHVNLLQECFIPRAMMSALDAHYSFIMLFKHLHDRAVPNFSTVALLSALFQKKELAALIFQCTSLEASYLGRFLHEIIKQLAGWHKDKSVYEKEALGIGAKSKLLGFSNLFDDAGPTDISYEEFRRLIFTYHSNLYGALNLCFDSGEYAHVRNGIVLLKALSQSYPQVNFHGTNLLQQINRLSTEEKRQDLQLMAKSLIPPIKLREKQWVPVPAFRLSDKSSAESPSAHPPSSKTTPKLNASAPEFKPHEKETTTVEDGEVEETTKQEADTSGDIVMKDATDKKSQAKRAPQSSETPTRLDDKRDLLRENGTKPTREPSTKPGSRTSTPAPVGPKATSTTHDNQHRESLGRHVSTPAARGQPALPSRPEQADYRTPMSTKLPPAPSGSHFGERSSGRRDDNYGRLNRSVDFRPGSREHSPGRGRGRTPPPHSSLGPNREDRGPQRSNRDDTTNASRRPDGLHNGPHRSHDNREWPQPATERSNGSAPPHQSQSGHLTSAIASSGAQPTGPRSAMVASSVDERKHNENPERLAQINAGADARAPRDIAAYHRPDPHYRNDNMPGGNGRGGRGVDLIPPTGPRSSGRPRGDMAPPESSYGRLNAPETPAGPRGAPQGPSTRNAPSGPGGRTGERHADSPSTQRSPVVDRRQSDSQVTPNATPATPQSENASVAGVHPSRLAQVKIDPPAPLQTNIRNNTSSSGSLSSPSAPPSGPKGGVRGPTHAPAGPSPTTSGPPTGPATDRRGRSERNGSRTNMAVINATLETAGAGASFRGSGHNIRGASRQGTQNSPTANGGPPVQAIASSLDAPGVRRHENASSRPASRTEMRQDAGGWSQETREGDAGRHRRREDDGGDRQRGSRNPSRERRPDDGRGRRTGPPTPADEGPNRRAGDRGADRPWRMEGPPPPMQQIRASSYGQPQWANNPNDDHRRSGRPGGRGEDFRGPRREEERRGPPPPLASSIMPPGPPHGGAPDGMNDGRKRRYEDATASDPSKRRRSGRG